MSRADVLTHPSEYTFTPPDEFPNWSDLTGNIEPSSEYGRSLQIAAGAMQHVIQTAPPELGMTPLDTREFTTDAVVLQRQFQAMSDMGLKPEVVFVPEGLTLEAWGTLFNVALSDHAQRHPQYGAWKIPPRRFDVEVEKHTPVDQARALLPPGSPVKYRLVAVGTMGFNFLDSHGFDYNHTAGDLEPVRQLAQRVYIAPPNNTEEALHTFGMTAAENLALLLQGVVGRDQIVKKYFALRKTGDNQVVDIHIADMPGVRRGPEIGLSPAVQSRWSPRSSSRSPLAPVLRAKR